MSPTQTSVLFSKGQRNHTNRILILVPSLGKGKSIHEVAHGIKSLDHLQMAPTEDDPPLAFGGPFHPSLVTCRFSSEDVAADKV